MELNEFSYNRTDALIKLGELGYQFMKHFDKIYQEPDSQSVNHWCNEMQSWYNQTRDIKLSYTKSKITENRYWDWFLTAGSTPYDMLHQDEDEAESYTLFGDILLDHHRDKECYSIKDALKEAGVIK